MGPVQGAVRGQNQGGEGEFLLLDAKTDLLFSLLDLFAQPVANVVFCSREVLSALRYKSSSQRLILITN